MKLLKSLTAERVCHAVLETCMFVAFTAIGYILVGEFRHDYHTVNSGNMNALLVFGGFMSVSVICILISSHYSFSETKFMIAFLRPLSGAGAVLFAAVFAGLIGEGVFAELRMFPALLFVGMMYVGFAATFIFAIGDVLKKRFAPPRCVA